MTDVFNTPEFEHGKEVGEALAAYDIYREVRAAYLAGEIELWLEWQRPKEWEEWEEFYEKHGSHEFFETKWKQNEND